MREGYTRKSEGAELLRNRAGRRLWVRKGEDMEP